MCVCVFTRHLNSILRVTSKKMSMIMLKAMVRGPCRQMEFKGRVLVKVGSSGRLKSWAWEMGRGFRHLQSLQQSLDWVLSWRACLSDISEAFGLMRLKEQCLYLASAAPNSNFATNKIQLYGKEFEFQLGSFQNKMKS